jgi:hypothetical protein
MPRPVLPTVNTASVGPLIDKRQYFSYHCTGAKRACGNSYMREEDLGLLLGELVKRVRIPTELADELTYIAPQRTCRASSAIQF